MIRAPRVVRRAPRTVAAVWITAMTSWSASAIAAQAGPVERARDHFFTGAYDEAITAISPASRGGAGDPAAVALHVRILDEIGRWDDALDLLGGRSGPAPSPELERWKGDVLFAVGDWDGAEAAWTRSLEANAGDRQTAWLHLADLAFRRGDVGRATEIYDSFIDVYNSGARLGGEDLLAVGHAVRFLGRETPSLFQDALRAYDEAAERLPAGDPRPHLAAGELFLSKYVAPDAHAEFQMVLEQNPEHPDALLGEARTLVFDGAAGAMATAMRALASNPNHVGAHTLVAEMRLQTETPQAAIVEADKALAVNPASLEARSVLAAAHYLSGNVRAFERERDRILAVNPSWSDLYVRLAELSADSRKYADAVRFAGEAVERDSLDWAAWGLLGMNQLRIARIAEGRRNVERAFDGDPFNPWFKNTLDLLDRMDGFGIVSSEHFEVHLPADEVELLGPRVIELAEEAFAAMSARYGAEPPTPIRLEMFPSSNDFSVRTLGVIGLGALGVSFGSTLVMDSPSARDPGEFNWASTLWHEIAHAFHLAISDHEVPRWFSEGLAVREQRVARPAWGFRASPDFLRMYATGQMPPLSRLSEVFVRPAFPAQIVFGYLQGSLAFDWIEERWGFPVIRRMLDGYRDGRTTAELTNDLLGMDDEELDEAFDAYMRERFATEIAATAETAPTTTGEDHPLQGNVQPTVEDLFVGGSIDELRARARQQPGNFEARLAYGYGLLRGENWDDAEAEFRAAQRLFPGYAGPNGPLAGLAAVHRGRGEPREAADALRALAAIDESAWDASRVEAELRREIGDADGELAALRRGVELNPFDLDLQARLGELAMELEAWDVAVAARRAVVALGPVDVAQARYELARAHFAAGEIPEARSAVLRALEIAPSFDDALDLLLDIRAAGGGE